ncbi:hypothetical protein FOZ61_010740 [Perkinsus olseni]|uniref:Glycosyltransferase 61 catalytic domain-containing protein n=1 Tax=Perkinsus olseni TaxID=32597 RepID=A0A7J6KW53_PEROL|nr:hypothetical protein FOZ61_010740 [Perkinsus olseni]
MAIHRRLNDAPPAESADRQLSSRRIYRPSRGVLVFLGLVLVFAVVRSLGRLRNTFGRAGVESGVAGSVEALEGSFPVFGDGERFPYGRPGEYESVGRQAVAMEGWPPTHDEDEYCKSTTDEERQQKDWVEAKSRGVTAVMFTCRPYFDDQLISLSNIALTATSDGDTRMVIFGVAEESNLGRRLKAWLKPQCRWQITKTPPWTPWGKLLLEFRPEETFPDQSTSSPHCREWVLERNIQIGSVAYPDNTFHVHNNFLIPLFVDFLLSGLNSSDVPHELWLRDWPYRGKTIKIYELLGVLFPRIRKHSEVMPSEGAVCVATQLVWPQDSSKCIYYNNVAPWGNDAFWRGIVPAYQHQVFTSLRLKSYWKPPMDANGNSREAISVYPLVQHERLTVDFDVPSQDWSLPERPRILWTTRETTVPNRHIDRRSIAELSRALEGSGAIITMVWPETFGQYGIREWMELLQKADIIMGPFGSGLANVVYMRPGSQLVDFATTNHPFNPDFLAMARHSRVGYFCADVREFPRNADGGIIIPGELISPLAREIMSNYGLERGRPLPRLQDPIDLCDGGRNVFKQCKRPAGWHANASAYGSVMTPFSSSRCYYQHRGEERKCYGTAHIKKKECTFNRPHSLCTRS